MKQVATKHPLKYSRLSHKAFWQGKGPIGPIAENYALQANLGRLGAMPMILPTWKITRGKLCEIIEFFGEFADLNFCH